MTRITTSILTLMISFVAAKHASSQELGFDQLFLFKPNSANEWNRAMDVAINQGGVFLNEAEKTMLNPILNRRLPMISDYHKPNQIVVIMTQAQMADIENAEQKRADDLRAMLGPKIAFVAMDHNRRTLENLFHVQGKPSKTYLANDVLQDRLKLDDEQRETIQKLQVELDESVKGTQKDLFASLAKRDSKLNDQLLEELTDDQRKTVGDLIGDPAPWHRLVNTNDFFEHFVPKLDRQIQSQRYSISGTPISSDRKQEILAGTILEFDDVGFRIVDVYLKLLLEQPGILDEIKIRDGQRSEVHTAKRETASVAVYTNRFSEDRFEELMQGTIVLPKPIEKCLTDSQKRRLRQIELQLRLHEHRQAFGLIHPAMIEKLRLSNETVRGIRDAVNAAPNAEEMTLAAEKKVADIEAEFDRKMIAVLDAKQRLNYVSLTGIVIPPAAKNKADK
jgi:hypothetical protein